MNWLDILIILILALSVASSFRKGLTREVIGLASLVAGLLLGAWFYGTVAAYLARFLSSRAAANFVGFLLIFCGALLLGAVVSGIVGKFLKVTGLSFFDHLLGAVFGFMRGSLVVIALIMGILAFSPQEKPPQSVTDSKLAPYAASGSKAFVAMAPRDLKDGFHKTYAQARTAWDKAVEKGREAVAEKGKK